MNKSIFSSFIFFIFLFIQGIRLIFFSKPIMNQKIIKSFSYNNLKFLHRLNHKDLLETLNTPSPPSPNISNDLIYPQPQIDAMKNKHYLQGFLPQQQVFYPPSLIQSFLQIKIHSLLIYDISPVFTTFLIHRLQCNALPQIRQSISDTQILSQILLHFQLYKYVSFSQLSNILIGNCLLCASALHLLSEATSLFTRSQYSFALAFTALGGQNSPFLPSVHLDKNHFGQILYAREALTNITIQRLQYKANGSVQDPYSMRCAPQICGLVYQCLNDLSQELDTVVNQPHCALLHHLPNLLMNADALVLRMDYLMLSISEVGSIAFIRTQRLLNVYLYKLSTVNKGLYGQLQRGSQKVADNKILCEASVGDTTNMINYEFDIFRADGRPYDKWRRMKSNLEYIIRLEEMTAIGALKEMYPQVGRLYQGERMEEYYEEVKQRNKE